MPTYDYVCKSCEHEWELFQSITANPIRKCPECGKLKAQRMIGAGAGILFKGSGFYQTDYRSDSYKKMQQPIKKCLKNRKKVPKQKILPLRNPLQSLLKRIEFTSLIGSSSCSFMKIINSDF